MLKKGSRILALDDGHFTRGRGRVLVVGVIGRDAGIEGILSFDVAIDGSDATERLLLKISKSRFGGQIKLIAMNGVSFGGMNIVDLERVNRELHLPVLAITRKRPRRSLLISAVKKMRVKDAKEKERMIRSFAKASTTEHINGFYVQRLGINEDDAEKALPVAVQLTRLAHLVASGVTKGESVGRI